MKLRTTVFLGILSAATALAWAPPLSSVPPGSALGGGATLEPPLEQQIASAGAVARADVDLDGRDELLVTLADGRALLVRRSDSGELEDCTRELGLAELPAVASALWHDVNGDGAPELFVVARDGAGHLFRNESGWGFTEVTAGSGIDRIEGLHAAAWIDVDLDGPAELLLTTASGVRLLRHAGDLRFEASGLTLPAVPPVLSAVSVESRSAGSPSAAAPTAGTASLGRAPSPAASTPRAATHAPAAAAAPGDDAERNAVRASATAAVPLDPSFFPPEGLQAGTPCAHTLRDQATGTCLRASSVPALGKLYPLSPDLYVDAASGHVGVGTTNAVARLDVDATGEIALSVASQGAATSTALFSGDTTSPLAPTMLVYTARGGTAAFFENRLTVGTEFFGLPGEKAVLGLDSAFNAELLMRNSSGLETVDLVTEEGAGNGAQLELRLNDGTTTLSFDAEAGSLASKIGMYNRGGTETVELLSQEGSANGAQLVLRKDNGVATMVLDAETSHACELSLRSSTGQETIEMLSEEVLGDGAQIVLRKADGTASIVLDAEQGANGRITTDTLAITGGADLVESFRTREPCPPGSVVAIDPESPGALVLSSSPYDRRVAGIVSGAGGVRPGLHLGQQGVLEGDTAVALTGRVYVRCSTENGAIRAGDLLTSSSTPGVAMRASDPERTFGAVVGKAMGELAEGSGLVLVLVGLQ